MAGRVRGQGTHRVAGSGARFLTIAAKGFDLIPENAGTLLIASRQSNGESEFELLELMFAFDLGTALQMATRAGGLGTRGVP